MENDIITYNVTITGYNSDGDGVARLDDGKVVFVRGSALATRQQWHATSGCSKVMWYKTFAL